MSDEISRYGGWYKHSNLNYEDFEMWNSVCEDAEPDWEYRNSQRAKREEWEREARAAARQEQEKREVEARKKRQREEQEKREWEAGRKEQETKERKQREEQEKAEEEAQEEMKKKADIAKAKQANDFLNTLNQLLAKIRLQKTAQKTRYEEENAVFGAEEDRDWTSIYEKARSADAARTRFQALIDAFGVKKTTYANHTDHADHDGKSVKTDLAFELNHLEDILRTMAESLKAEQTEDVRSKDQDQDLSTGWSVGCVSMRGIRAIAPA